jgi:mycothiol synthase
MSSDGTMPADVRLRPWRDDGDWARMAEIANGTREVDERDTVETTEHIRNDYMLTPGFDPVRSIRLAEVDGTAVGWAVGTARPSNEGPMLLGVRCRLVPEWRSDALDDALLVAAEACATTDADTQHPGDPSPRQFQAWVGDTDRHTHALMERGGYAPVRWGHEMARNLADPIPDAPLPPGVEFRPVTRDVAMTVLRVFDEAARDTWEYPGFPEDELAANLDHPVYGQLAHWVVAWAGDEPVSGSLGFVNDEENEAFGRRRGYVESIWTRRTWRGRGLASAVIARSLAMYREEGMTEGHLSVDTQNPSGALGLYERMGFRRTDGLKAFRKPAP